MPVLADAKPVLDTHQPATLNLYDEPIPLVRYQFQATVTTDIGLPDFAGSALRGIFGGSLKKLVCMTKMDDCNPCSLRYTCPYTRVFDVKVPPSYQRRIYSGVPNPYVIEPIGWGRKVLKKGDTLEFGLVLFGPVVEQLPIIVFAFQNALRGRIGAMRGSAELERVCRAEDGEVVWRGPKGDIQPHNNTVRVPKLEVKAPVRMTLTFTTPLRLQRQGKRVSASSVTASDVLNGITRRVSTLVEMQLGKALNYDFQQLSYDSQSIDIIPNLQWREWSRYSNRQDQSMKGSGVVGTIQLQGDLEPYWPFLYLGTFLHVGKLASCGNGQYSVTRE